MSHRSRTHPAVHYVTSDARDVYDEAQLAGIHRLCEAFAGENDPLDAERATSRMHGRMWELRRQATTRRQPDWSFGLGAPFARELARHGGIGAKGLLMSLAHQAPPRLAQLCFELAFDLPVRAPRWATELPGAELTRAARSRSDAGVQLILVEFRRRSRQPFCLAVMVNETLGGIVRRYGLVEPLERFAELGDPDGSFISDGLQFAPWEGTAACRRIRRAIERTDAVAAGQYDLASARELRALTLGRVDQVLEAGRGPV